MFSIDKVGLREALLAVDAVLREASTKPHEPISIAIVDQNQEVIVFARMDGALPFFNYMAVKKARTSSMLGLDTSVWGEFLKKRGYSHHDFLPDTTGVPGGVAIVKPGQTTENKRPGQVEVFGGIGVSGRSGTEDEQLAKIGLLTLQKAMWGE